MAALVNRFEALLARGELYQQVYLDQIDISQYDVEIAQGCFKEWDIRLTHKVTREVIRIEVKSDTKSKYTGNIVIEFACNGVPSGIDATTAHYWIHFVPTTNTYYQIPVKYIRNKIAKKRYLYKSRGGDGGRAEMYVFPIVSFERFKKTTITPC